MNKELYINGSLVDINEVNIIRKYTSPFFSDATTVFKNGTYTVQLPMTVTNCNIFGYSNREDVYSPIPYIKLTADYYVNGLPIFENAECILLQVTEFFEVQFTYGIDKGLYSTLFTKKCNEITANGTTITEDDWLVNWTKADMFASGKKYSFIDYFSVKQTKDVEVIAGVSQPAAVAPEPFLSNQKEMTMHPFVKSVDILDVIAADAECEELEDLKTKIGSDVGLILNGGKFAIIQTWNLSHIKTWDVPNYYTVFNIPPYTIFNGAKYLINPSFDIFLFNPNNQGFEDATIEINGIMCITPVQASATLNLKKFPTSGDAEIIPIIITDTWTEYKVDSLEYSCYEYSLKILYDKSAAYYTIEVQTGIPPIKGYFDSITNLRAKNIYGIPFSTTSPYNTTVGIFNCLASLPDILQIEFIQQMLITSGLFLGSDTENKFRFFDLETFKSNLLAGNVTDWSGRISNVRQGIFVFNSNAQSNYIKFANDKDLINRSENITVDNSYIDLQKDLYSLNFNSPLGNEGEKANLVMYEQSVKKTTNGVSFENKYIGDGVYVLVETDNTTTGNYAGTAKNVNIIGSNYDIYQKIINRPIIKQVDVNLDFFESANIDFEKPIYIEQWGKYCLLLDLTAPDNEVSVANLLLINQEL